GRPPAVLGFRSHRQAEAAELVPNAQSCVEPTLVTELIPAGMDVLACGPEPMLEAVRHVAPAAQLAWEAPMACGYGACYGCAVEVDGSLKRLCVEGPVLNRGGDRGSPPSPPPFFPPWAAPPLAPPRRSPGPRARRTPFRHRPRGSAA